MDILTIIVSAIAAGASAGLKPAAKQAIKDAYQGIKGLIVGKYAKVDVGGLEKKPDSKAKQDSLKEDLQDAGAAGDRELLAKARELLDIVERMDAAAAAAVGVDIAKVKAAALKIGNVSSTGVGVRVQESEFRGDIQIGDVTAGQRKPPAP